MRLRWLLMAGVLLSQFALAEDSPQVLLASPCTASLADCRPSKSDLKKANAAFSRALRLEKDQKLDEAYQEFDAAARLVPDNISYVTALAVTREKLIADHLSRGNTYLNSSRDVEAEAEFRGALNLDPENKFAQQRLAESFGLWAPKPPMVVA